MTETELSTRLPTNEEKASASEAVTALARAMTNTGMRIPISANGERTNIEIPTPLANLVLDLLMHVSKGEAVTLVPYGSELTTQQAADLLNVSRPFLIKLLESGELKHYKVGRHRRVLAQDLIEYKEKRGRERREALDKLTEIAQEANAL